MSNIHAIILLAIGLALLIRVCYEMRKTYDMLTARKNRRRMWEQENAQRDAEIAQLFAAAKLQQKIEREKKDMSAVSVPVTTAERETRRQRIRRLHYD